MDPSKLKSLLNEEIIRNAKNDLQELEPVKEKLLEIWGEVPEKRKGEVLAILLYHTRDWRKWDAWNLISPEQIMDWLRGSFQRAQSAYPEIKIPEVLKDYRPL